MIHEDIRIPSSTSIQMILNYIVLRDCYADQARFGIEVFCNEMYKKGRPYAATHLN